MNEQEQALGKAHLVHVLMNKGLVNLQMDLVSLVKIVQIQRSLDVKLNKMYEEQFTELVSVAQDTLELFKEFQAKK